MGLAERFKSFLTGGRVDLRQRFQLLREATAGTMSQTYKARDLKNERIVALKILDAKKTAEFEARFTGLIKPSEGEIAKQLDHPAIVTTHEYGMSTTGQPFLVMEFLEGVGMHMAVRSQTPKLDGQRVTLLRQAAEALQALHSAGFIHRDVCPRNYIIGPDYDSVKLIDFGLTVPATKPFMQPGNRTGTPNYMAPELVKRQPTDERLDVFAFGITAYELCTFQLPWERGNTGLVALSHANNPPVDIHEYRPQIHPQLAEAIAACIQQSVLERCPTVAHFLKMIRGVETEDQD